MSKKKLSFGERLRDARERLRCSRTRLGQLAGLDLFTIKRIERGTPIGSPATVLKVLGALKQAGSRDVWWVAAALDEPLLPPPPISARMLIAEQGPTKKISIRVEWPAVEILVKYLAGKRGSEADLDLVVEEVPDPEFRCVEITMEVADPDKTQ